MQRASTANALSTPATRAAYRDFASDRDSASRFADPDEQFVARCRDFERLALLLRTLGEEPSPTTKRIRSDAAEAARTVLLSPLPRTVGGLVALHEAAEHADALRLEFPAGRLSLKPLLLEKAARAVASGAGGRV